MRFTLAISCLASFASVVLSQEEKFCGTAGQITVIGSSTVFIITNKTGPAFTKDCKDSPVNVTSGGTSGGRDGVCAVPGKPTTDIGNMSRDWKPTEAEKLNTRDGISFKCINGTLPKRELFQLPVAIDGVSMIISPTSPIYTDCLKVQGLSSDDLKFLFAAAPTNPPPFDDPSGHYWNEICGEKVAAKTEIKLVAPSSAYGTYDFFKDVALSNGALRDDVKYFNDNSPELEQAVTSDPNAIGFLGYAYFNNRRNVLAGVTIDGVEPLDDNLIRGIYLPLGRRIYSNFWKGALDKTACFARFHLTAAGQQIVEEVGYLKIPEIEWPIYNQWFQCGPPPPTPPPLTPCSRFCFPGSSTCCSRRRFRSGRCKCLYA